MVIGNLVLQYTCETEPSTFWQGCVIKEVTLTTYIIVDFQDAAALCLPDFHLQMGSEEPSKGRT